MASEQTSSPLLVADLEAVALTVADVPTNFRQIPDGTVRLNADMTCRLGNPGDAERDECLRHLTEWGRLDSLQVIFKDGDPLAVAPGVFEILNTSSNFRGLEGVANAFAWGKARLLSQMEQRKDVALVSIPPVGDESIAFVADKVQAIGGRQVALSFYTIDFRRGNMLVRIATVAPKAAASVDDAAHFAGIVDARIIKGGEEPPARLPASASPAPNASAGPSP